MDLTEADYLHTPTGTRQRDLTPRVVYGRGYIEERYGGIPEKMRRLADHRVRAARAHLPRHPAGGCWWLDYGCGVGAVVDAVMRDARAGYGHDLAYHGPDAECGYGWNRSRFLYAPFAASPAGRAWDVASFFDVLEHLPDPDRVIRTLAAETVVVSVPWCHFPERWEWFRTWKHRRPGEHLHHWNRGTLAAFFGGLGYAEVVSGCVEDGYRPNPQQAEPNILTAVFRRRG